jgi:preprotein translocase subunit SecF
MTTHDNVFARLYRGETSFDFAGRWRRWFILSGTVILIGLISLGVRGINLSVDFKGGTIWEVPSTASVSDAVNAVNKAVPGLGSTAEITIVTRHSGQRVIEVQASAKSTTEGTEVIDVRSALATMADTNVNNVSVNGVGASWGADITHKAVKAVIIFLVVVSVYIWFRFEGKMAIAALVALLHDILVTVGIYSLSGFQVSPDTVIAFLTILGYSLYDTIVVFDKVQENTRSVASSAKLTYTDYVNLSMNQVLARSLNTSFVAIIPILSIEVIGAWILGATTLNDFGLALLIGLTTGAYSSIFVASPLLALLKEREPRYADIRRRMASAAPRRLTPAAAAAGRAVSDTGGGAGSPSPRSRLRSAATSPIRRPAKPRPSASTSTGSTASTSVAEPAQPSKPASTPVKKTRRPAASTNGDAASGSSSSSSSPGGSSSAAPSAGSSAASGPSSAPAPPPSGSASSSPVPAAGSTPVPPRSGSRPPPRPRKKRRR